MHPILGLLFGILILVDALKLKQANPHVAVEEVFINGFCSEEQKRDQKTRLWDGGSMKEHGQRSLMRPYYYIHGFTFTVVCVRLLGIPKNLTLYEGSHFINK